MIYGLYIIEHAIIFFIGACVGVLLNEVIGQVFNRKYTALFIGAIAVVTRALSDGGILAFLNFVLASILFVIARIDWDTMRIPNECILGVLMLVIPYLLFQQNVTFISRIIGFFIVSLPMLGLTILIPGAFGGGDIKLIAVGGLILGHANTMLSMFIALLLGGIYATYLLCSGKAKKGQCMSFGPYLCIGIYIALLLGEEIIGCYINCYI